MLQFYSKYSDIELRILSMRFASSVRSSIWLFLVEGLWTSDELAKFIDSRLQVSYVRRFVIRAIELWHRAIAGPPIW